MYHVIDPDEHEVVLTQHTCEFHKRHPGEITPFCTCSMHTTSKRRDPLEIARIKANREREREDRILAEAEIIRRRRARPDASEPNPS